MMLGGLTSVPLFALKATAAGSGSSAAVRREIWRHQFPLCPGRAETA
jgi:hypothetical protein